MKTKTKWLDGASLLTLILTVILFGVAAVEHGLTRDLLLEAGVFLISLKLVLGHRKLEILLEEQRQEIRDLSAKIKN